MQTTMTTHAIVPRDEWLAARAVLLELSLIHISEPTRPY